MCVDTAPGLVQTYQKYKDQGVLFLSLTTEPKEVVQAFVEKFEITWSNGYGASIDTVQAFGAPEDDDIVKPTFFVIGRDRHVSWCDQHLRAKHEKPPLVLQALENAIEIALAETF